MVATFKRALADAGNVNAGLLAPVKSVTAPDANTVVFNLKSTYPSLPTVLGEPAFLVFPASGMADTKTFLKNPISAGPYKIESWDGSDITLVKNPNFWGPKPAVNTIKLVTVIDPNTRLVQLKGGELDIADSLSSSVIPQLTGNLRPSITPLYGAVYLYVNNRNAPLNNTNVRQAISLAMDRDQINQIAFSGKSSISDAFFPQTFQCCYQSSFPSQQNIDKAKSLLAGTPCANGCNLKLMLRNGLDYADRAGVVVQQNLKAIGINASIQQVDPSVAGEAEGNGTFELEVNSLYDYVDIPGRDAHLRPDLRRRHQCPVLGLRLAPDGCGGQPRDRLGGRRSNRRPVAGQSDLRQGHAVCPAGGSVADQRNRAGPRLGLSRGVELLRCPAGRKLTGASQSGRRGSPVAPSSCWA